MTGPVPDVLGALRRRHERAPLASAAALFAVLAAVRLAGAFDFTLMVLSVALSACALLVVEREGWHRTGLRGFPPRTALLTTGLVALVYAQTFLAARGAFGAGDDNWTVWVPRIFQGMVPGAPWADTAAMLLCLGLLVPLVEEVCYRGVLYEAVERERGGAAAVVTTAAAWSFVHLGDYGLKPFDAEVAAGAVLSVFLMGLALGLCRAVTGSVPACAAAQGVCNLMLLAAVYAAR